jgi:hypothetical protein
MSHYDFTNEELALFLNRADSVIATENSKATFGRLMFGAIQSPEILPPQEIVRGLKILLVASAVIFGGANKNEVPIFMASALAAGNPFRLHPDYFDAAMTYLGAIPKDQTGLAEQFTEAPPAHGDLIDRVSIAMESIATG